MPLGIIFATSLKGVFALNGKLPWHCKSDMDLFRRITTGTNIVMGRKTMESIEIPLPKRQNYVLTRSDKPLNEGFIPITMDQCFSNSKKETFWVIGGIDVIEQFIQPDNIENIDIIVRGKIGDSFCHDMTSEDNIQFFTTDNFPSFPCKESFQIQDDLTCEINHRYETFNDSLDDTYLSLGKKILTKKSRMTRNGLVRSSFDPINITTSFEDGFPILQSKRVWWKGVYEEFNFFLSGDTDTNVLSQKGVKIWEGNTSEEFLKANNKTYLSPGEMGPMYGFQWRHFGCDYFGSNHEYKGLDQIEEVIQTIIKDPTSRRILMTTYNPAQAPEGVLYPCHGLITQFYVEDDKISLKTYQRSADWVLGVPFNISSYGLLLDYIVNQVNERQSDIVYIPDKTTTIFGDAHIYESHVTAFLEQYVYSVINKTNARTKVILNKDSLENYYPVRIINAQMVA